MDPLFSTDIWHYFHLTFRKVDFEIIKILKQRYFRCSYYERAVNEWHDLDKICQKEKKELKEAELNLFIKCKYT